MLEFIVVSHPGSQGIYLQKSDDRQDSPHSPSSCPSKTEIRSQLRHIDTVVTKKLINSCQVVFTHLTKENRNGSVCYCQCRGSVTRINHEGNRTSALTELTAPEFIRPGCLSEVKIFDSLRLC